MSYSHIRFSEPVKCEFWHLEVGATPPSLFIYLFIFSCVLSSEQTQHVLLRKELPELPPSLSNLSLRGIPSHPTYLKWEHVPFLTELLCQCRQLAAFLSNDESGRKVQLCFLPAGPPTCLSHHLKSSSLQNSPLLLPTSHLTAAEGHCCISSLFHVSKSICHFLVLTAPEVSRPFFPLSIIQRRDLPGLEDTDSPGMVLDIPTAHSSPNPTLLPVDQAVTHT